MILAGRTMAGHVQRIVEILERDYQPLHPSAHFDVYAWTPWLIRIRIINPDVAEVGLTRRSKAVWDMFESLPDETYQRVGLILMLAPEEFEDSPTNQEFERDLATMVERRKARADAKIQGAPASPGPDPGAPTHADQK